MELSYRIKIEKDKCIVLLPDNANLLDIHAILLAFKHSNKLTVKKILLVKHEAGIKKINDITEYIRTSSFMELEHTIRKKLSQNREESSHILQNSKLGAAELHIECIENIKEIPQIQDRKEVAEKIIESFKKKWRT